MNFELSFFAYVMLVGAIVAQTSQVRLHTDTTLFECSEQVQVSEYHLYQHLHLFHSQILICCHCHCVSQP